MEKPEATASAVISFAEKLEDNSLAFYGKLAEKFPEYMTIFLSFAEDAKKNKVLVTRTYQETITDALEACFSFEGLRLRDYVIETTLAENVSCLDALKAAVQLEEKACKFYTDAAEQCMSLLATIPRVFRRVAEERSKRKLRLESLLRNMK